MTSNLGSQLIQEKISELENEDGWDEIMSELRAQLFDLMRQTVKPEFINRVDEIILFKPLTSGNIQKIVELQLNHLEKNLKEKGLKLTISNDVKEWLGILGYDPQFGARPLKRIIQKHITNKLSEKVLDGTFTDGDIIEVNMKGEGQIEFKKK